jgi:Papain-like cysteine protease AvrRpt2
MGIYRVPSVPLIGQKTDGVCWFACARMLAGWRVASKGGLGTMKDPMDTTKDCFKMADRNAAMLGFAAGSLKGWLGLVEIDMPKDQAGWTTALTKNGPLWAPGMKHWAGTYGHVVVVYGSADTGLLINDPEPVGSGKEEWRTWASMNKYFDKSESAVSLLACP